MDLGPIFMMKNDFFKHFMGRNCPSTILLSLEREKVFACFEIISNNSGSDLYFFSCLLPEPSQILAVQFTVEGGREAQAADILQLMADYLDISYDVADDAFALWLISPLLGEVLYDLNLS